MNKVTLTHERRILGLKSDGQQSSAETARTKLRALLREFGVDRDVVDNQLVLILKIPQSTAQTEQDSSASHGIHVCITVPEEDEPKELREETQASEHSIGTPYLNTLSADLMVGRIPPGEYTLVQISGAATD